MVPLCNQVAFEPSFQVPLPLRAEVRIISLYFHLPYFYAKCQDVNLGTVYF